MKTKELDVILICKGWYNKEKYNCPVDALKAYQARECLYEVKYLTYDNLLNYALYDAAKEYFKPYEWIDLIRNRMVHRAEMDELVHRKTTLLNSEAVCNAIIEQFALMRVKEDNGDVVIDLSDYGEKPVIV